MKQKQHTKLDSLLEAATQLSAGAATHAVSLGLVVGTKPSIDAEISALETAVSTLRQGQQDLRKLRTTYTEKQKAAYDLANSIRDHLKRTYGRSYNPQWEGTGFNQSLRVPRKISSLELLLQNLESFFTENVASELANVATAALANTALDDLSNARTAVKLKQTAVRGLLKTRKTKERAIRRRIRGVVEELMTEIGPIDERWEAFGLNQPGIKQKPEQPGIVTVVQNGAAAALEWDRVARTDHYRVWLKVIGVDGEPNPVGTPSDPNFALANLPSGKQVEVSVSAVNNGGESLRSEPVVITVP